MIKEQMELGFGNGRGCPSLTRRQLRLNRAQSWFQRMRQVVDRAVDWQPISRPRPEQIWFPHAYRQVMATAPLASPEFSGDEQQICE